MSKPVKARKTAIPKETSGEPAVPKEPKKRASRAKPKPTKAQILEGLSKESTELKQQIANLKEDQTKIQGISLKELPLLIEDELTNLEGDLADVDAQYQEVSALPEDSCQ